MTVVVHPLGKPLPAHLRGGDCRARNLDLGRNVHGPHDFHSPVHCQVNNGMLRATVTDNSPPTLSIDAWRGAVVVGDVYEDTYTDTYGGSISTPEWMAMGSVIIDSPSVAAVLTAVHVASLSPEAVTIALVCPLLGGVYVTLPRGVNALRVQHGVLGATPVARRVRWEATPSPVGTAMGGRVEEVTAGVGLDGLYRFVASLGPVTVDAGAFSVTTPALATARLGAGVGISAARSRPVNLHQQLGDASRSLVTFAPEPTPGEGTYGSYEEGF